MVSIVIPFFEYKNQDRFTVWNSLKIQEYAGQIEVIVVDDGSSEEYHRLIKEKTKGISGIKIIRQKRLGFSAARNEGIRQATGELIVFWEQDGVYAKDTISQLEKAIKGYDLAVCSIGFLSGRFPDCEEIDDICCYGRENRENLLHHLLNRNVFLPLGNKMYCTDIIKTQKISFDENASEWNCDELFNLDYFLYANKINVIHQPLYTILITSTLNSEISYFDEHRLLLEHKAKSKYYALKEKYELGEKFEDLIRTLFLNKIYLAVANMERGHYSLEDKLQFVQVLFNDNELNEILNHKKESVSFAYFFVEYMVLAVLDSSGKTNYIKNFQHVMLNLMLKNHADLVSKDELLAVLHKTRKYSERNSYLLSMIQADVYLSLFCDEAGDGNFVERYFEACREKCKRVLEHPDNLFKFGQHIYDAVKLDLA